MPPPRDPPPGAEGFPWRGHHACPPALSSGHAFGLLLFLHDEQSCSELGSQSADKWSSLFRGECLQVALLGLRSRQVHAFYLLFNF